MKKNSRQENIIFNCYSPLQMQIVAQVIKKNHFNKIWCVYNQQRFITDQSVNWLYFPQIAQANYQVDSSQLLPLDEELLIQMAACESQALKMMDRLTFNGQMNYQSRKEQYFQHLRFWHNLLKQEQISSVVFGSIPHEVYDFILYHLCKLMKVKTIIVHQNRVYDSVLSFADYQKSMSEVQKVYQRLEKTYRNKSVSDVKLAQNFAAQFSQQTNSKTGFIHFNIKPSFSWKRRWEYFKTTWIFLRQNPQELVKLGSPLFWLDKIGAQIMQLINKLEINIFLSNKYAELSSQKKYIYFPLHLQPECTTSPMAGVFVDQHLMLDLVTYCLPADVVVMIKEHPSQPLQYRSVDFYRQLLKNPQAKLVHKSASSRELIKNSLAVMTATGTAGWEALFLEKPVLMFGSDIFQYAPGIFSVKSVADVKKAWQQIQQGHQPRLKTVKIFLKAMEETLVKGYVEDYYQPFSRLSETDNIVSICLAIEKQLNYV